MSKTKQTIVKPFSIAQIQVNTYHVWVRDNRHNLPVERAMINNNRTEPLHNSIHNGTEQACIDYCNDNNIEII